MDILYYSNYCKHSQKIIQTLVKANMADKISFICIDKRTRDNKSNQIFITLENGSKVILPPNVQSVPSLLLVKHGYKLIIGDDIIKHYHDTFKEVSSSKKLPAGEPSAFYLGKPSGGTNIVSEQYTMYNLTPDELSAKGNSSNRQLYNYVSVNDNIQFINTPEETYQADKVSSSVTVDKLQQSRLDEMANITTKQPLLGTNI
jgi:hypothetical protein